MTTAIFLKKSGNYCGFYIFGHSGYSKSGEDIICSAVSSAVYLTANNLTELYKADADIQIKDSKFCVYVKNPDAEVSKAIKGLFIHLFQLSFQYPEFLKIMTVKAK